MSEPQESVIPTDRIARMILVMRGHKVILDADLAELYGVQTRALNQAVKRNQERFPPDFVFQLTPEEKKEVITNCDHLRGLRFSPSLPYAFTEHGALMAASVLNTRRAAQVSIFVVRAFIQLRQMMASHRELARKVNELERHLKGHDEQIRALVAAIRRWMSPETKTPRRIGFSARDEET